MTGSRRPLVTVPFSASLTSGRPAVGLRATTACRDETSFWRRCLRGICRKISKNEGVEISGFLGFATWRQFDMKIDY